MRSRTGPEGEGALGGMTVARLLGALRIWTDPGPPSASPRPTCDPALALATQDGGAAPPRTGGADAARALLDDACSRAARAGHGAQTVDHLREVWSTLGPGTQRRVAAPLSVDAPTWRGRAATQVDGTTCGAAVGAMLLAAGDPVIALALETGTVLPGVRDRELAPALAAAAAGFDALQHHLLRRTARRAVLGVLPWPRALGTPPWSLAREARCGATRYRHVVVDVAHGERLRVLSDRIGANLRAGVPLPLFTGGASRSGWSTAVPRHVVLLIDATATTWRVYEPARGRVHVVDARTWAVPERRDAWGRWSRPHWLLLPR